MRTLLVFLALCACASAQPFAPLQYHRTASAAAWKPSDLDSLYVWLQADSITGKSHGDTVGIWRNAWAAGNVFNTTSSEKPIYATNIIGGKPALLFDGSEDNLQSKNNALGYKTGLSVFVVAKYKSTADNKAMIAASNGRYGDGEDWFVARPLSGNREYRAAGRDGGGSSTSAIANNGTPDTLSHVHAMLFSAADSVVYWVDGTRAGVPSTISKLNLAAELDLAMIDNGGSRIIHANVYIAEIIIYGGRKSNADAKLVRDYLKAKYSTP